MKRTLILIVAAWLSLGVSSAHAQFFFNPFRKAPPPVPPAERVGQLVTIVKSDPDERKRTQAVEELRDFDTKSFPQIVDILADIAQNDAKPGVRGEAVSALVRMRPVSPTAGQAIEHVASKDENWRNRMNAQAALVRYRLAGYSATAARTDTKPPVPGQPPVNQSAEPPLGNPPPIIYHDQTGKVIPAPKNAPPYPFPQAPQVIGTPTSNPANGSGRSPFAPIGSAPVTPPYSVPPQPPTSVPQTSQRLAPPSIGQPQPVVQPQPKAPVAIEPTFRNVNRPQPTPPGPLGLNPLPTPTPIPAVPAPPRGPSLELPPLPINPTPAPAPVQGPSLDGAVEATPIPAGRMDPSPRLSPNS